MESLHTPPETSSFVLLADHQARTPSSFHSGPPVLHYHSKSCKLVVQDSDLAASPALGALRGQAAAGAAGVNGSTSEGENQLVIEGVDVWVTSDKFLLYNPTPAVSAGVAIPYPSISLHAIQRLRLPTDSESEVQGLYMQIAMPPSQQAVDDEEECITMTVVPSTPTPTPTPSTTEETPSTSEEQEPESPIQKLYAAVSACSNLHPDPVEPGDEEDDDEDEYDEGLLSTGLVSAGNAQGGMPPPMDGSSGWITAENMHEFFDEEGNWIAGGEEPSLPLGPGAGSVRQRGEGGEDEEMGDVGGERGEDEGGEETKWRRTD
ncbi:Voldacs domain-containing protein [Aspergillus candidus]|uniref:Regulator of volume decrease after cellular swelling-domain-containing protein n=1 Tax=Aspergillus candidus TaxID=41067 RepID=A0A2I2F577_ASPCN|nr:regulator of volume decrease after cellular swelling-domain-containing protein [Aspergillus candidus]PLB35773.1 regulator of volume decrease after cellular swelling-domain-containing protein [Aspergillus candidus]